MKTEEFAQRQVTTLLERLAFQIGRARHSQNASAIHDLRVAIRRFLQTLVVFKPWFPSRNRKTVRRSLKNIMALAGAVRDCDIALEYLSELRAAKSWALQEKVQSRRGEAAHKLRVALQSWLRRKSFSRWRFGLEGVRHSLSLDRHNLEDTAYTNVSKMARAWVQCGNRAAGSKTSGGELHRFRIATKKFRYTLEIFAPLYGPSAERRLEVIAGLQSLLGRINDCRTARTIVSRVAENATIEAALKKRQRRRTEEFRRLWHEKLTPHSAERHWMNALRSPPKRPLGRATTATRGARMAIGA